MPTDHLNITFAALADPTRRSILTRLAEGEANVHELAEPFSVSLQAVPLPGRHAPCARLAADPVDCIRVLWKES